MAGKGDKNRSFTDSFRKGYSRLFGDKCRFNHQHTRECPGYEDLEPPADTDSGVHDSSGK